MTKDEIRLALDEEVGILLDELADTCEHCGKRTKEGADIGCPECLSRELVVQPENLHQKA